MREIHGQTQRHILLTVVFKTYQVAASRRPERAWQPFAQIVAGGLLGYRAARRGPAYHLFSHLVEA